MGLGRNFTTIRPYMPGTRKPARVCLQLHIIILSVVFIQGYSAQTQRSTWFAVGDCGLAHFLAWLSAGRWRGFPCRSRSPSHLCTSRHMLLATQQAEYAPCPSPRHSITPNFSLSKSMLLPRRDAMGSPGHSSRNKLGGKEAAAYGTSVRLRPVT